MYFVCGIIATLAYRIVVVLNHLDPIYVQVAWYIGTIGFIIYFAHRYRVSQKRARIIAEHDLEQKVAQLQGLSEADKQSMEYIFGTLRSTKEKWNSIVIFVSSGIALFIGILIDFVFK